MRSAGTQIDRRTLFYALRVPASAHVICELQLPKMPTSLLPQTINLDLNTPFWELEPGKVNFIGDYSIATKSIVETIADRILITDTPLVYLKAEGATEDSARLTDVVTFLNKYYPNIDAPIVGKKPIYLNLRQPADTMSGYTTVVKLSSAPDDPAIYAEQLASLGKSAPRCIAE